MSDLRGVGRSVDELFARKEDAAPGGVLRPLRKKQSRSFAPEERTETPSPGEAPEDGRKSPRVSGTETPCFGEAPEDDRKSPRVFKSPEAELLFAKEKALRLLGDMDRTKKELSERLSRAGCSAQSIQKTLEYLARYGYVDDARYAGHYYARYCAERGERRIRLELLKKGIARETVEAVFAEAEAAETEGERGRCLALAKKRAVGQDLSDPKVRSRLLGYLARRGFREADIRAALREIENQ